MSLDNLDLEQIYGTGVQPPVAPYIPQQMSQEDLQQAMGIPAPVSTDSTQQSPMNSPLPFQAKPVLNGGSIEQGGSASYSGFSPEKYNQITKTSSIVDKRVAKDMAPVTDMLKKQEQDYSAIAKDRIKNQQNVTDIEKQKADINSQYEMDKADIINKGNLAIQNEIETGRQNVATAMANHQKMMEQFQAMSVNPGDLYNRMTTGERAGTSLAVAASAFLGAKGIGTPIMGIIDKAIDRNIDAQLANIKKKGQEVGMAADVVNMVRQTSRDDLEAKMRLKDMALESAAQGLTAEFSKFGSKLAEAKGAEAVAMIKEQQLKVRDDLNKQWLDAENVSRGQRISEHNNEVNASVERAGIASRERIAALEHQAKMGDPLEKVAINAVWDVSPGADKGWLMRDGIRPEDRSMVLNSTGDSAEVLSLLKEANELSAEIGKQYRGPGEVVFTNKDKARFDQILARINQTMQRRQSGLSSTDNEWKRFESQLRPDSFLTKKNFDALSGQMIQLEQERTNRKIAPFVRDMPDNLKKVLRDNGFGPPTMPTDVIGKHRINDSVGYGDAVGEIGDAAVDDNPTEVTSANEYAKVVRQSATDKPADNVSSVRSTDWEAFSASKNDYTYVDNRIVPSSPVSKQFVATGDLYDLAKTGDTSAINELKSIASDTKDTITKGRVPVPTKQAEYAQFFLDKLDAESSGKDYYYSILNGTRYAPPLTRAPDYYAPVQEDPLFK